MKINSNIECESTEELSVKELIQLNFPNYETARVFYNVEEILDVITSSKEIGISDMVMKVNRKKCKFRTGSDRYQVFNKSLKCVCCENVGNVLALQKDIHDPYNKNNRYHFNLYMVDGTDVVMITKDHIVPKSKGGENGIENYQTMCSPCNFAKGNFYMEDEC